MIIEDLSTAKGPTATELKVLERLGRHRSALEAAPADEEEAYVVAGALETSVSWPARNGSPAGSGSVVSEPTRRRSIRPTLSGELAILVPPEGQRRGPT